jgi:anti-sigma B factor antagonist
MHRTLPSVRLAGEIDVASARDLNESLGELVGTQARAAIIDVRDVTFIDTTAVGALVRTSERLRRQSRSLILICPPGPVHDLLEACGMLDRFLVMPDEDAAAAAPGMPQAA